MIIVDKNIAIRDITGLVRSAIYTVEIARSADAELRAVRDARLRRRICQRIEAFAADPHASHKNVRVLKGGGFRLRVGAWRVIFTLDHDARRMVVLGVRPRGRAYE